MKVSEIKEHCSCVYKITFPDGKSYVGQTSDLADRMKVYALSLKKSRHLNCVCDAFLRFGFDSADVSVLVRVSGMNKVDTRLCLNLLEIHYIRECGTLVPNGYNTSLGGEIFGIPPSSFGLDSSQVSGYYSSGKSVLQYDEDGKFMCEYKSIAECAYKLGTTEKTISGYLKRMSFFRGKYLLHLKKGNDIPQQIPVSNVVKKVKVKTEYKIKMETKVITNYVYAPCLVYDDDGNFVKEFVSKNEALRHLKLGNTLPYGTYRRGYVIYKKPDSGDYPMKIEKKVETEAKVLGDYYRPLSECEDAIPRRMLSRKGGLHKKLKITDKVLQYNLDGTFVAAFPSVRDASVVTGIPYSSIYSCLYRGIRKSHGYIWKKESHDK